jgi:hypothetical protein
MPLSYSKVYYWNVKINLLHKKCFSKCKKILPSTENVSSVPQVAFLRFCFSTGSFFRLPKNFWIWQIITRKNNRYENNGLLHQRSRRGIAKRSKIIRSKNFPCENPLFNWNIEKYQISKCNFQKWHCNFLFYWIFSVKFWSFFGNRRSTILEFAEQ